MSDWKLYMRISTQNTACSQRQMNTCHTSFSYILWAYGEHRQRERERVEKMSNQMYRPTFQVPWSPHKKDRRPPRRPRKCVQTMERICDGDAMLPCSHLAAIPAAAVIPLVAPRRKWALKERNISTFLKDRKRGKERFGDRGGRGERPWRERGGGGRERDFDRAD